MLRGKREKHQQFDNPFMRDHRIFGKVEGYSAMLYMENPSIECSENYFKLQLALTN